MIERICVVGLGYIGFPTSLLFAEAGFRVFGYDIDRNLIRDLGNGILRHHEVSILDKFRFLVEEGKLPDFVSSVPPADVYIVCVPTPLKRLEGEFPTADLSLVYRAIDDIAPDLTKDSLVIIESTCPVGTTRHLRNYVFNKYCKDIDFAYCPERMIPGNAINELTNNARVIGGISVRAADRARRIYRSFVKARLELTSCDEAEFVKLSENTFRDVNIAFANQLAELANFHKVDINHIIELVNLHPRVNVHTPSIGVGGHCIPIDPWFLLDSPEARALEPNLIHAAREINDNRPALICRWIERHLPLGVSVETGLVCCLGKSYKRDSGDIRESPAVKIWDALLAKYGDLSIDICDPVENPDDIVWKDVARYKMRYQIYIILVKHNIFRSWVHERINVDKWQCRCISGAEFNLSQSNNPIILDCTG